MLEAMVENTNRKTFWLIIVIIGISGASSHCAMVDTLPPIDNMTCKPFAHRSITAASVRQCTLTCIQSNHCEAMIYDKTSGICMLMNDPCFSLETNDNHVYRSFRQECIKWVPPEDDYLFYHNVARHYFEGGYILGKVGNRGNFRGINPSDTTIIGEEIYERLVVNPSCNATSVTYDASSGQPIPKGAVIGGTLNATNTPLYVAHLYHDGGLVDGYYNPLNNKAWAATNTIKSDTVFEFMVVNWL